MVAVERCHDPRVDLSSPEVVEAALPEFIIRVTCGTNIVRDLGGVLPQVLDDKGEVLPMLIAMLTNIGHQPGQATGLGGNIEVDRVVKSDSIDLEGVHPVEAHVADKLLCTSLVEIEILQPRKCAAKAAYIGARIGILIQPAVGEAVSAASGGRHIANMVKDPVHDDVDATVVELTDELFEP